MTDQMPLFGGDGFRLPPAARRTDPNTSWAAWLSIEKGRVQKIQAEVYEYIFGRGQEGATNEEICRALAPRSMGYWSSSARNKPLLEAGFLCRDGTRIASSRVGQVIWKARPFASEQARALADAAIEEAWRKKQRRLRAYLQKVNNVRWRYYFWFGGATTLASMQMYLSRASAKAGAKRVATKLGMTLEWQDDH